jgi:hypothetical protein
MRPEQLNEQPGGKQQPAEKGQPSPPMAATNGHKRSFLTSREICQ